jgi:hypothetical protein
MVCRRNARRIGLDEKQSAKMYPSSSGEWSPAHDDDDDDDDPQVLANRHGREGPCYVQKRKKSFEGNGSDLHNCGFIS